MRDGSDFWSRRKAGVKAEARAEEAAIEAERIETEQAGKSDEEILAGLGLPDPDGLAPGDDFSGFMAQAVPDRLRRRALRRLWRTNPVLANVDGLVDYGEDFTDAACVIDTLQTAYQVGKGMTAHIEEMARQAALADTPEDEAPTQGAEPVQVADQEADLMAEAEIEPVAYEAPLEAEAVAEEAPAPRRRMRFEFEDEGVSA